MEISELLNEPIEKIKEKVMESSEKYYLYSQFFDIDDPSENSHYLDIYYTIQVLKEKYFKNIEPIDFNYELEKDDFNHMKKYSQENFIEKDIDIQNNGKKAKKDTRKLIKELYEESKEYYGKKYDEILTEVMATLQVENIIHESGFPLPDFIENLAYYKFDGRKRAINNIVNGLEEILHLTIRNSDKNTDFSTLLDYVNTKKEMELMFNFYVDVKPKRNQDLRNFGEEEYKGLAFHLLNDLETYVKDKINLMNKNMKKIGNIDNLKIDFSEFDFESLYDFYDSLDKIKRKKMLNQIEITEQDIEKLTKFYSKTEDKKFVQNNLNLKDNSMFYNKLSRIDKKTFYKNLTKSELEKLFSKIEDKNDLIENIKNDDFERFSKIFNSYLKSKSKSDLFEKYPVLRTKIFDRQFTKRLIKNKVEVKTSEEYKKEFKYWDVIENNLNEFNFKFLKSRLCIDYKFIDKNWNSDYKKIVNYFEAVYGILFDFQSGEIFYHLMNKSIHEYNKKLDNVKEDSKKISKELDDKLYSNVFDKVKSKILNKGESKEEVFLEIIKNYESSKYIKLKNNKVVYDKNEIKKDVVYESFELNKEKKLEEAFAETEYPYAVMFIDNNFNIDSYFKKSPRVIAPITINKYGREVQVGVITDVRERMIKKVTKTFGIKYFDIDYFLEVHE